MIIYLTLCLSKPVFVCLKNVGPQKFVTIDVHYMDKKSTKGISQNIFLCPTEECRTGLEQHGGQDKILVTPNNDVSFVNFI